MDAKFHLHNVVEVAVEETHDCERVPGSSWTDLVLKDVKGNTFTVTVFHANGGLPLVVRSSAELAEKSE